jgi:hypothetical protein
MSEETTPPPPPPAQPAPPPAGGFWWFAWILATVIMPGLAIPVVDRLPNSRFSEAFCWAGASAILFLHIVAAARLGRGRSGCLPVALFFGGWVLMLASFFVGCVSVMNKMSFH